MPFGIGLQELLIIGVIAGLIFGPSQLPKLGRGAAETIREFRKAGKELVSDKDDEA